MTLNWLLLSLAALAGSTLAGITGFGGAAILLPALVYAFGVKAAIPILTVAQLIGNGSRVYFHRHALDWQVVRNFAITAVPSAVLGSFLFSVAPVPVLIRVMGAFLLATVIWRWAGGKRVSRFPARGFLGVGAAFSFLSAIVGSVGPFIVPFFLSYGLVKSAFIGTEALCTVVMHVTKLAIYRKTSLLSLHSLIEGAALGPIMVLGSWLGKKILKHMPEKVFVAIVELTLLLAGANFLFRGI